MTMDAEPKFAVGQTVYFEDDPEQLTVKEVDDGSHGEYRYLVEAVDQPPDWYGYWFPESALTDSPN